MQKILLIIVLVVGATVGLYWWQATPQGVQEAGPQPTGLPMKVALQYWPGQYWVAIADAKGWFADAGLNVTLVDVNGNFSPSIQDFVDGQMDAHQPVLFDFVKYNLAGADLVAVAVTDASFGGDGIVAKRPIQHMRDLKGRRVSVEQETFLEFVLHEALQGQGLTLNDVTLVRAKAESIEAFVAGRVDAVVTFEPFLTEAVQKGQGRVIFDTSHMPRLISDVMAFHRDFIRARPGDVQAFVSVWHKTTQFIKTTPDEAFDIIAKLNNVTPEAVRAFAEEDHILDLHENRAAFLFTAELTSLHGVAHRIHDYMMGQHMTDAPLDSTLLLDPQFLRRLH